MTGDVPKASRSSWENLKAVRGEVNAKSKGRSLCQIVRINYLLSKGRDKAGKTSWGNCVNIQAFPPLFIVSVSSLKIMVVARSDHGTQ